MNHRFDTPAFRARRATICPATQADWQRSRGSSNLRSNALFFSVNPDRKLPSFPRNFFRLESWSAGTLTHSEADRNQHDADVAGIGGQFATALFPQMTQNRADVSGSTSSASDVRRPGAIPAAQAALAARWM